jgi:hypothetical protein
MIAGNIARPTTAFLVTGTLLILGIVPLPAGWALVTRQSLKSAEPNRADRDANAGGYYEGLIGPGDGGRNDLPLRLQGKPADWVRFQDIDACRMLSGDVLQFELRPDLRKTLFGQPFTTNALGMRDRETNRAKPPGTFRIALLGSSMDMGWGVGTDQTYENRLEDWLNAHAARRGLHRHFEVLNFAVAAYSPLQRLDSFSRKAAAFEPDLVIYSATMLDIRLLQIHLCNLLQQRIDPGREFIRQTLRNAGFTDADAKLNAARELVHKDVVKAKLQPHLWAIDDAILDALAGECRSRKLPLVCVMIPRVGEAGALDARTQAVRLQTAIAARHAIPLIDLTDTFDSRDPAGIEIAAWDDHPNAFGHKLLFLALAHKLVEIGEIYRVLFEN